MPGRQYRRSCGRGVFALSSWEAPRRPEGLLETKKVDTNDWKPGQSLMMKYRYEAKPDSPLGKELTVKQKDVVTFVSRYDEHWILVNNEQGDQGHIPSSYVMSNPDSVKSLPWLDQKAMEESVKQEAAEYKPYKSAYAPREKEDSSANDTSLAQYYCKVCEKQLNGPIPYNVHLNSKAHKEEVALRDET